MEEAVPCDGVALQGRSALDADSPDGRQGACNIVDEGFDEAFAELKAASEAAAAGRAALSVNQYEGPGGVRVVCQEAFHHNFDLTHEHWAEVLAPSDEASMGGEVFRRSEDTLAFVHLLLTGDKAAGKTTFLNGLTTGDLRVLQCLRYDSGLFYNIWYAPSTADLVALRGSLSQRALPFFQTELAHGGMLMDAAELRFFLEDEEFNEGQSLSAATTSVLDTSRHVMVKLLELGGDCLHEFLALEKLDVELHPVKSALLRQTAASLRASTRAAYFVNLTSLFACGFVSTGGVGCDDGAGAEAVGAAVFVERLAFLSRLLREDAEVLLFCTRRPAIDFETAMIGVRRALALAAREELSEADVGGAGDSLLRLVAWLAARAGFTPERLKVYHVEHLCHDSGDIDHTAVLQSLRRLLGGDPLNTPRSALSLLAEQVAHLLFNHQIAVIDKHSLAVLLEEFDDSGHAEVYRKVLHPMVVLPPMVLLDSFAGIMQKLVARGLVCPADDDGQIPLEVQVDSAGVVRARLRVAGRSAGNGDADGSTIHPSETGNANEGLEASVACWRVLAQDAAVKEARRSLNLFQLEDAHSPVPSSAAEAILRDAWAAAVAAWATLPAAEAFSELYLAARFLLSAGYEASSQGCFVAWDRDPWSVDDDEAATSPSPIDRRVDSIVLRMPQDIASTSPWCAGVDPMVLTARLGPIAKRPRVAKP